MTVEMGFGAVSFPPAKTAVPTFGKKAGEKLACNRGTFALRYDLARSGGAVRARQLSVKVRNDAEYLAGRHPLLEEHEKGHQRINTAGAADIEKKLSAFQRPGSDMKAAERELRGEFGRALDALRALHREWDATSVLLAPPAGEAEGTTADHAAEPPAPRARRAPHPADLP